jgi:hypothetical protein
MGRVLGLVACASVMDGKIGDPVTFFLFIYMNTCIIRILYWLLAGQTGYAGAYPAYPVAPPLT